MKNRLNYIDCLKGIGIILVVLGHLKPGIYIEKWIYSFHMFLFFFLSGYVHKKRSSFSEQVKLSAKGLLIPYLFYNGAAIAISLFLGEYTAVEAINAMFFVGKVSWNAPVWFLLEMFWLRLFAEAINATEISVKKLAVVCALLFALGYFDVLKILPLGLKIFPVAMLFYLLGVLKRRVNFNFKFSLKALAVFLMFALNTVTACFINARISVYGSYYGNYAVAVFSGICGVLCLYELIQYIYIYITSTV